MKKIWKFFRGVLVIALTVALSTIAINATDNASDLSNSLLGSVIQSDEPSCPEGMSLVLSEDGDFCIDSFEASASPDCLIKQPNNQNQSATNLQNNGCKAVSVSGTKPWTHIARHQAELACAHAGKRLPSNKEWYRAALGTPDPRNSNACNIQSVGNEAADTGTFSQCVSSSGVQDMVGNVWEWVSGTVKNGLFEGSNLPSEGYVASVDEAGVALETSSSSDPTFNADYFWVDTEGARGMLRGGYYKSSSDGGVYTLNASVPASFVGVGVGFRCVK